MCQMSSVRCHVSDEYSRCQVSNAANYNAECQQGVKLADKKMKNKAQFKYRSVVSYNNSRASFSFSILCLPQKYTKKRLL